MNGHNSIELIGRVGKDPELKQVGANDLSLASFSIATDRIGKSQATDWHQCKAWGKSAEVIAKYVVKGSVLHVQGTVQYGSYEKDGVKVRTTDIVVNNFTLLSWGEVKGLEKDEDAGPDEESDLPF